MNALYAQLPVDPKQFPLGSEERPVPLNPSEYQWVTNELYLGEQEYDKAETPEEKEAIRFNVRLRIITRHPELYDHCHVVERPYRPFEWQTEQMIERCRK